MIKPNQKFKVLWDILILHIILFFFLIIPLQLAFDIDYEEIAHDYLHSLHVNDHLAKFLVLFPEILLILDSLLKLITGYYENGLVITSKAHIVSHYLKKGLIFDLLSYCPVILQSFLSHIGIALKILQFLIFLKVKRIKIIFSNFQEMISLKGQNDYILSLLKLVFQIIFFAHLNACIWHSTAYYNPSKEIKTWLDYSNVNELTWISRYFYSMFWAVSVLVTIGFGEKISPQNDVELVVGTMILLISALFFGYTINAMRDIFDSMNKKEKEYKFIFIWIYLFIYLLWKY